ncbi:exosortase E/protease, VPEID-CTERM system [Leisingera sp. ANG-M6]|uniref:exosortase E/protease, VPEID-CTERM system n=1 Tax=Leisingera sp. ANG-M6 TaxID=1577900 RepID=UPI00057D21A3|nr:exosortase E/protease, VPEID-CTERM system [Leisingera sp. ANG-M6]KIC27528.1 CAAX protease [Leisingera sp. ANG-M6]
MQAVYSRPFLPRLAVFAAVLLAEVLAIRFAFQFREAFSCAATTLPGLCAWMKTLPLRTVFSGLALAAAVALKPSLWGARGARPAAAAGLRPKPALLHLGGLVLLFAPLWQLSFADLEARFALLAPVFLLGAFCAAAGALLWLMPLRAWRQGLSGSGLVLPLTLAAFFALPDIVDASGAVWGDNQLLTRLTFAAVDQVLSLFHTTVTSLPEERIFALNGFAVQVGDACSGIEGFALIALFMGGYALLCRGSLRLRPYWLVLFPLAVLLSWAFNVLRISVLIWIGAYVSPALAVEGFHSYAGWLVFSLLALAILISAHNMPLFQKPAADSAPSLAPSLAADPLFARIVPFILFMISGTLTPLFWEVPSDGYPLRAALMLLGLGLFWPALKTFSWRAGPLDWLAGAAVAALWLWTAPESGGSTAAAPDPVWIISRLLGTVLLVPVIEELFFRAYVLERIAGGPGAPAWRAWAGLAASSLLFAALHGRWLAGGGAGIVFGLLYLRSRRPGGAVQAHILANALIAAAALAAMDFDLL